MVQRYNPDYVMHAARFAPFARENEHGEFVKFSDYEVLKAERDTLADRVERLSGMLTESRVATKSADERADALSVRNERLTAFLTEGFNIAGKGGSWCGGDIQELGEKLGLFARETYQPALHGYHCGHEPGEDSVYVITNSATDSALAAIRNEATARALKHLCDCQLISATVAELKADELREVERG
ncbi:hypothetical protein [Serratia marcescens]|uniref:hypothetical protein n=1 Tax=Serratia marcescens TaxID=615 RepID=UPI000CCE82A5|nr:hypothetical protein [Serratia marcescens]PNU36520.1 hypothetical protein C2M05_03975 [Serratia marcescens]